MVKVVQPELELEEVVVHRGWVVWGQMGLVSFETSKLKLLKHLII
jgi:hypothetical protein